MTELLLIERALRQCGILSRDDVRRMGVSDVVWYRLVASGAWRQIVPGLFHHAATVLTLDMQVRAGSAWLGSRGRLFGQPALWWLGVEVPVPERISFQTLRGSRQIPPWMELHTTTSLVPSDTTTHRGVPCSVAARAVLDWATQMPSARRLGQAIDDAHRRRLLAIPRLQERLDETGGRGRRGTALLRELMLDAGGESFLERRFLALMRTGGQPRPRTQVVHRADGVTIARVDFQFAGSNLIVEVSGRKGHASDAERRKDARRRNALQAEGFVVLEFVTADVIDDPGYVLGVVRQHLALSTSRVSGSPAMKRA